ncbi:NADH-quinone oxidoreductase subunit L [Enemella sp. A6]|uniref:NADH-quinone oxidoreductase subunit L n=1 Tax=Enemella sp. A6 TaxID=3440152 RepID=UPI003EB6A3FD
MIVLETLAPVEATGLFSLAWLVIAIPAISAAFLLVAGKIADSWGHLLGTLASLASAVLAVLLFVQMFGMAESQRAISVPVWEWINTGAWTAQFALLIDPLSILFMMLITVVGSLIHIYSIGYMAHDERRRRFFAFLNLFIAAMLILVMADNYLLLFLGWEGVGLASYLLIGFWQHRPSAAAAANKAFIMNRVGDVGMVIALGLMFATFGSTAFSTVNDGAGQLGATTATVLGLLLLLGACAKSAQVPLQAWLLDAMEGPTPVSALIHAATMVTAGVYLVVRSHAIFAQTPAASTVVVIIGTVTLLVGAWIGTSKDDIKKVLAGSTMSQIGYMMLAAGIGPIGYAYAIFHLITHGFFKANMFLGAGSVMHGMNDDVNMRNYGALAKLMPLTFGTFAMGFLAIIGFPFFSGYYSKDHIIVAAFEHNMIVGIAAIVGAGVTAFYMTRLMLMTFFGKKRWDEGVEPHESPLVMTLPLILLAIPSIGLGLVMNNWIGGWLAPAVGGHAPESPYPVFETNTVALITLAVVAVGIVIAVLMFRNPTKELPATRNPLSLAGRNDLYGDAINNGAVVGPFLGLTRVVTWLDDVALGKGADGTGTLVSAMGSRLRRLQTGYIRSYGLMMVAGVILVAAVLFLGQLA